LEFYWLLNWKWLEEFGELKEELLGMGVGMSTPIPAGPFFYLSGLILQRSKHHKAGKVVFLCPRYAFLCLMSPEGKNSPPPLIWEIPGKSSS
jgi:hypothetical protein